MPDFRALRTAWNRLLAEQQPDALLTFNLHHALTVFTLQRLVTDFVNRMQREIDGRNWSRLPAQDRPRTIGIVEHPDTNPHAHVALSAPPRFVEFVFSDAAQALWHRCHPHAGQFHAERVSDAAGLAAYMLKDLHVGEGVDRLFVYMPTRGTGR